MKTLKIKIDDGCPRQVLYGIEKLETALEQRGVRLENVAAGEQWRIGTPAASPDIDRLVEEGRLGLAETPESLAAGRVDGSLFVAGRDTRGLLYALLELADRIALEETDPEKMPGFSEAPQTAFRGIFTFLHNRDCEMEWFYSREHWIAYFDLLARSRFNSFHLVFAHQTAYLAPPFPFFVHVPEHPEVTVPDLTNEERDRNLAALNMIAEVAEERGLDFVVGLWEFLAWSREITHSGHVQKSMVDGLGWNNLESYTHLALKRLLAECPGIKGVQLRVNPEAGIPSERQTDFFRRSVFRALRECGRNVLLDLRGWGALPETIRDAGALDIPVRLSMKYWAEHLGAPYQAPLQHPAYSYADFLRRPQQLPVSYQVWALGSHRLFQWGDPEYARTFSRSLSLGDAVGFEISPPLAQKGYGNEPGAWRILEPEHDHTRWEFERYWLFYTLFGRLTYRPDAEAEVWMREMRRRFGKAAEIVMEALTQASRVLSFIMRFNMSDPNMYIWPEADTGGLLDFYVDVAPSDPARIKSFSEAAEEHLAGRFTARMTPKEASRCLRETGEKCLRLVGGLARDAAPEKANRRELRSILVDAEALGELALYHAEKILAGESLTLYYHTGDCASLRHAEARLRAAAPHWRQLAAVTDGVYTDRMVTGPVDSGHWKDRLILVEEDLQRITELQELHRRFGGHTVAFDFGSGWTRDWGYVRSHRDYSVERGFTPVDEKCLFSPGAAFGWRTTDRLASTAAPRARLCDKHLDRVFRDAYRTTGWEKLVPFRDMLTLKSVSGSRSATFACGVPAGRHEIIVVLGDRRADSNACGPLRISVNGRELASGLRIPPREVQELRAAIDCDRAVLELALEPDRGAEWRLCALIVRPVEPVIAHTPPRFLEPGREAVIRASVTCPEEPARVELVVRTRGKPPHAKRGAEDTRPERIPMRDVEAGLLLEALIPQSLLDSSVEYWFEAESRSGRRSRLPDAGAEPHFFTLTAVDRSIGPRILHDPPAGAEPGKDIVIRADIRSSRPLSRARLHYRHTNQFASYRTAHMELERADGRRTGAGRYTAAIPGDYVVPEWDIMYYLEAVDEAGCGAFYPPSDWIRRIPYCVVRTAR